MEDITKAIKFLDKLISELQSSESFITSFYENSRYSDEEEREYNEDESENYLNEMIYDSTFSKCTELLLGMCELLHINSLSDVIKKYVTSLKDKSYSCEMIPYHGDLSIPSLYKIVSYRNTIAALCGEESIESDKFYFEFGLLNRILRSSGVIIRKRSIVPSNEIQVQNIVFEILSVIFPDCLKTSNIHLVMKTVIPDLSILSIKTLIEVKYINAKTDLPKCSDEILADMAAYGKSKDFNNYITLWYMTESWETEEKINSHFESIDSNSKWKHIAVIGPGK